MDITLISDFIGTMGFPIFCVVAMFWMWNKEREEHKVESDKWCEAINNNTRIMERIYTKLEIGGGGNE